MRPNIVNASSLNANAFVDRVGGCAQARTGVDVSGDARA